MLCITSLSLVEVTRLPSHDPPQEAALKLMLLLTDAGVSQSADLGTEMIAGGAVPKLIQLLSSDSMREMAAAVLGNLCHESPENQDKLADNQMFQKLAPG